MPGKSNMRNRLERIAQYRERVERELPSEEIVRRDNVMLGKMWRRVWRYMKIHKVKCDVAATEVCKRLH